MATQEQLIAALRQAFPDVVDGLDTVRGSEKVMGFIASDHFEGMEHEQRQDALWRVIDNAFQPDDRQNIGPIATMTLEEARLHATDAE